ncbi:hypothetical protein CRE_23014 [Caenorhabditis remanei]|uniref:Uncharacterized protein n=1 Tax=Caenorhabditis remanei TaxID=31234 RepID=E3N4C8_CAERE|nr:hypothetical protein CRE_23014 [Caenorhabditis remanei]
MGQVVARLPRGSKDEKEKNALDVWFSDELLEESEKRKRWITAEEANNLFYKNLDELYEIETEQEIGDGKKLKKRRLTYHQ